MNNSRSGVPEDVGSTTFAIVVQCIFYGGNFKSTNAKQDKSWKQSFFLILNCLPNTSIVLVIILKHGGQYVWISWLVTTAINIWVIKCKFFFVLSSFFTFCSCTYCAENLFFPSYNVHVDDGCAFLFCFVFNQRYTSTLSSKRDTKHVETY